MSHDQVIIKARFNGPASGTDRTIVMLVLVACLLGLSVTTALACSCRRPISARDQMEHADVVFIGTAIRTERTWFDRTRVTTVFDVTEVLKGPRTRRIRIEHGNDLGGGCGIIFNTESPELVLARRTGWSLVTGACSSSFFPDAEYRAAALNPSR